MSRLPVVLVLSAALWRADAPAGSAPAAEPPAVLAGRVVGIADGDTLTVLDERREQHKVRLNGIDAPEKKQAFGTKARQALSEKVVGKPVRVEWRERDRYGRIVADVYLDTRLVNLEQVRDGWAWRYKRYSSDPALAEAEDEAREARRGLWADPEPVPPWEFRKPPAADPPAVERPSPEATPGATVYVTRTGTKYHAEGGRHLSGGAVPLSLNDARQRYSPCSVCRPPQ